MYQKYINYHHFASVYIFQYQRWLYPVDKSRIDDGTNRTIHVNEEDENEPKKTK